MAVDAPFLQLIVAGVDGSTGSDSALQWTAQLAKATGAAVLAVHVLTYNQELLRDLTPDTMHTWRRELEQELRTSWVEALTAASVEHRTLLAHADSAAKGLIEVSDAEHADLLIVGTKGHGGFAGRVLGSTTYRLAHHARQPVLVIPHDVIDQENANAASN